MNTYAVIGYGGRGSLYTRLLNERGDFTLTAVCDINPDKLDKAVRDTGISKDKTFLDPEKFFAAGKLADALVLSTMDRTHYQYAIRALNLGYDLLLEKPIAETAEECRGIYELSKKLNRKVEVCHVLRYSPFYALIKQKIDGGELGKVVTVTQTENVGWYHQAHSFVRGNWGNSEKSSPMILQKCCHDMDILYYLIGKDCKAVSSFGSLTYFTRDNAPEGSADYCFMCPCADECIFNCMNLYKKSGAANGFLFLTDYYGDADDNAAIERHFSDKNNRFARCVYKCDNDVVDHQVTNLLFDDGVTAQLTMTAFSAEITRVIKVHLTKGEIVGDMGTNTITFTPFGGKQEVIDVKSLTSGLAGHGGGDARLVDDFAALLEGKNAKILTDISKSLMSHQMCYAAEESRKNGGKTILL